ncbi:hypothetical protein HPB50_020662 [Hyalomma asiaticum]|uniref:Uncharacterized protein n=1 Tax=Hyalomma asiaticum TaxID=266040 RepID=A0ACB7SJM9_HYAAI|nr:hypothetical protein HPB50_020662 [Hyalomma asiaticum]
MHGTEQRKPMYQLVDGVPRCLTVKPDTLRKNLHFKARKGDVVQSSFPKSGSHWMMYIVQLILRDGEPIHSHGDFMKGCRFLEYADIENWESLLPLRAFMTHLPLSEDAITQEGKYIYVARNPWDVCVSFYHMATNISMYQYEDATFEEFVDVFISGNFGYGDYFDHVAAAYGLREKPNVLFVTYEEMKKNTKNVLLKVARFLGDHYRRDLAEDEIFLDELLKKLSPEFMRNKVVVDIGKVPDPNSKELSKTSYITCKNGYGGDETKYNIVRTANVGGWKEYFTPHLLKRMEERIREAEKTTSFMDLWKDVRREAVALSRNFCGSAV